MGRPRIRTVKPEAWQDEKVGKVSRDGRLLFVVLITLADDEGRFRLLPSLILGHGYPYDSDAGRKLKGWLSELESVGLVVLYESEGVEYGALPSWQRHQRINRSADSILPPPPGHQPDEPPRNGAANSGYKKSAIPERVRREVARREGAVPGETVEASCHYCPATGTIYWPRLGNGKPGSWVSFSGLELDHVLAEFAGGEAVADNIVLACQPCNRSKGHGNVTEFRDRLARNSATGEVA